jgi:hypothetical protein
MTSVEAGRWFGVWVTGCEKSKYLFRIELKTRREIQLSLYNLFVGIRSVEE